MALNQAALAADISAKLATANAAIAEASPLRSATPVALAPARNAVATALSAIEGGIAALDSEILLDSVAGVVVGPPAPDVWPVMLAQLNDCEQLSRLLDMRAYLGRVATNLNEATG